jgi:hypothetical protein
MCRTLDKKFVAAKFLFLLLGIENTHTKKKKDLTEFTIWYKKNKEQTLFRKLNSRGLLRSKDRQAGWQK